MTKFLSSSHFYTFLNKHNLSNCKDRKFKFYSKADYTRVHVHVKFELCRMNQIRLPAIFRLDKKLLFWSTVIVTCFVLISLVPNIVAKFNIFTVRNVVAAR